jgi:FAD/FMN-containing dehydrogenase
VTAAWLKLRPVPEAAYPIMATFRDIASGCDAIETVLGLGLDVAAVEYLDPTTLSLSGRHCRGAGRPSRRSQSSWKSTGRRPQLARTESSSSMPGRRAPSLEAPPDRRQIEALWRWRDGISLAVNGVRGGKISEDIVVPLDRLQEAIERTPAIGAAHDLPACSWGTPATATSTRPS